MNNSRVLKSKKNIISAFVFQLTKILLVFLNRIIFVKVMGAAFLGINSLLSNILVLLSLADLGMTTTMMYSLYKPLAENDISTIKKYTFYFKKIYNYIALAVFLLGIGLMPFLKYIINLPYEVNNLYIYYLLLLSNTVLSYLFVYKTTIVQADQKMYILNKYDTIFQFIVFILQILIILITKSYVCFIIVNIVCTFLCNVLKVFKTEKMYPFLRNKSNGSLNKKEKKLLFKNIYSMFFYKLGSVIQSNTDNILISIFVGTITVGYYSNYNTILLQIISFLTLAFTSVKASLGNFVVEKSLDEQIKLFNILEDLNFILVSICSIFYVVIIQDFISLIFGNDFVLSYMFVICLVLNFYTSNIRQNLWMFRETSGMFEKTKYITLVTAIINIILSVIFGKIYGITGIVLATCISRMIYAWWKEPCIIFNDYFKISSKNYFYNYIKNLLLTSVTLCICLFVCSFIHLQNVLLVMIIKSILTTLIVCIIYYINFHNKDVFKFVTKKLLKRR